MLISQPGSDYQLAQITLDTGHTRDIMLMLLDVHAVLDQLHLDGTQPQTTAAADAVLRESGSPYTLPALISALSDVIDELTRATHHATTDIPSPAEPPTASDHGVGPNQSATTPAAARPGGAKSKYNGGATSG